MSKRTSLPRAPLQPPALEYPCVPSEPPKNIFPGCPAKGHRRPWSAHWPSMPLSSQLRTGRNYRALVCGRRSPEGAWGAHGHLLHQPHPRTRPCPQVCRPVYAGEAEQWHPSSCARTAGGAERESLRAPRSWSHLLSAAITEGHGEDFCLAGHTGGLCGFPLG